MLKIEELELLIIVKFAMSLILAFLGIAIVAYIGTLVMAKNRKKDLLHRLKKRRHVWLMRLYNIPMFRVLLVAVALYGSIIGILIITNVFDALVWSDIRLQYIPYYDYLTVRACFSFLVLGVIFQSLLGSKGLPIPIGDGLSISYDKGSVLAFHLDQHNPNLRIQKINIISAMVRIRRDGHKNEIRVKSWLCVARLPQDNAEVKAVRLLFNECSDIRFLFARKMPTLWILTSQKIWRTHKPRTRPIRALIKVANNLSTIIYALINARNIRNAIACVPETGINRATIKMMEAIRSEMEEAVTPLGVAPVPVSMFMNISMKLPHISNKFMGLDGGFTMRKHM